MGLVGADGRMGRAILSIMSEPFQLRSAFVSRNNSQLHRTLRDVGIMPADIALSSADNARQELQACDVMLSFASPSADAEFIGIASELGLPAVIGTTGHAASDLQALTDAAQSIPIVQASNFSLGIAVFQSILPGLALLRDRFDASLSEVHHSRKRDAPSGTALTLADAYEKATRGGPGLQEGQGSHRMPITSVRGGGVPGEHVLMLAGPHEVLRVEHAVFSRLAFAEGSLLAARWVISGRGPGLYSFLDVVRGSEPVAGGER